MNLASVWPKHLNIWMAKYRVDFTKSASKELKRLPDHIQRRIRTALLALAADPFSEILKMKKIKGQESVYRIRLGDYRVVYDVQSALLLVLVIRVGHRSDVYRGVD